MFLLEVASTFPSPLDASYVLSAALLLKEKATNPSITKQQVLVKCWEIMKTPLEDTNKIAYSKEKITTFQSVSFHIALQMYTMGMK